MNGKLKIGGLGLAGLMCAGMLFSCVLTLEASGGISKGICPPHDWRIIEDCDRVVSYDDSVHEFIHVLVEQCVNCKREDIEITELGTENHDIVEYWDSVENCWAEECGICGYTYYYH